VEYFFFAVRILLNPFVNLFQKKLSAKGASSLHMVFFTYAVCALFALPLLLLFGAHSFTADVYLPVAAMALVGTAGNVLLVLALSRCDLSIFGPINSFKPVIGLLLAFVMLREVPSARALVGVCVIVTGSAVLSFRPGGGIVSSVKNLFLSPGVLLRFASLTLISVEAVLMKKVVASTDPLSAFFLWAASGLPFLLAACVLFRPGLMKKNIALFSANKVFAIPAVLFYGIMQGVTFVVFAHAIVGVSLALFQLSTLVSVILGRAYFGEKDFYQRAAGALVMMAGAVLILV
jgi:drug/metabolite transporter (DMT)-like permease